MRAANTATVRLPAEAQARLDAWARARRAANNGGPEAMRCDVSGCPWPVGYCSCVRAAVA